MNTPTAAALVKPVWETSPVKTPEQIREETLQTWLDCQRVAKEAIERERAARAAVVAAFPIPAGKKEGTVNIPLNNGYGLKVVLKQNYNIDQSNVDAALEAIEALGAEGQFIAERLVKFKADLSLTEYRMLADDNATKAQKEIKKLIDGVLTITDGTPTLELKEPKAKV